MVVPNLVVFGITKMAVRSGRISHWESIRRSGRWGDGSVVGVGWS